MVVMGVVAVVRSLVRPKMARPPLDVVVSLLTEVHVRHCATMMASEGEVWRDPGGGFIRSGNRLLPEFKRGYVLFEKK